MEFLRSFLRRRFAGKPLEALGNVGCFLRLVSYVDNRFTRKCEAFCSPFNERAIVVPINSHQCFIIFDFHLQNVAHILSCKVG